MKKNIIFQLLFFLFSISAVAQSIFPGGVAGAEVWYIAKKADFTNNKFKNEGNKDIEISSCNSTTESGTLFNFNEALKAYELCLSYKAPLENTTARNVFFVGSVNNNITNYWHLTAVTSLPQTDSLVTNRFELAADNTYFNKRLVSYTDTNTDFINFYHLNMYQTDRKFKSYGIEGETRFLIGRGTSNLLTGAVPYTGHFPEFISFPFELSANQKNRVESYLALKYGITLDKSVSYRNSKNVVFWNNLNNTQFKNRIFGIGKDDISGLNQLQSESVHNIGYLVASIGKLESTNLIKQGLVSIKKDNFIVFGDNGALDGLDPVNAVNVRSLKRKWLCQKTGSAVPMRMNFKLNLSGAINTALTANNKLKLWMLHDKYVNNQQVSDFTSQYVEYYQSTNISTLNFGDFEDVIFDGDKNTYDQYTFGVGPEMIVQVRFDGACSSTNIKTTVVITGGTAPYNIKVNSSVYNQNFQTSSKNQIFIAPGAATYTINVTDALSNMQTVVINISSPQLTVDLGPDKILNANNQQVTLNADQVAIDPNATYKWYHNGLLIEHYQPIMVVTKPGEYKVEVMSGNRMCQKSDTVLVNYKFTGTAVQILECGQKSGVLALSLTGGTPPYATVVSGTGQTVYQVHNTENLNISDIGFGQCTLTTTDSNGEVFQKNVIMQNPLGGIQLDLLSQLQQNCTPSTIDDAFVCQDVVLNAGALVTNPNVTYEWFMNGNSLNIYTPFIVTESNNNVPAGYSNEFQVKIKNLDTGCIATEIFRLSRATGIKSINAPATPQKSDNFFEENSIEQEQIISINSKVYPNPSESGATFYYEVFSEESFDGIVEIYSPTGALLHKETISGESAYTVPFSLLTSGVYFIYTKTNGGVLLTDKIIIK